MDDIMWKSYMRKKQCINHELQIIDEDFESGDDVMKYKEIGLTNNKDTETEKKFHC